MKKIAIVIQRFGHGINGGAEVHAKQIADLLKADFDITVLTSCAEEYTTWEPVYTAGPLTEDNIKIVRITNEVRDEAKQKILAKRIKYSPKVLIRRKLYPFITKKHIAPEQKSLNQTCHEWLQAQGPHMPELDSYIQEHQDNYDAFIFFTALYYPTAACLNYVKDKAILIPLLHHESCSFFPWFNSCYEDSRFIFFNTKSEKSLAEKIYSYEKSKGSIVAVGVNQPKITEQLPKAQPPYIVYIGRVSKGKGCKALFDWFIKWKTQTSSTLQLVVIGKESMEVPVHPDIIKKGFTTEETKNAYLNGAQALVIPSKYESLSLVTLESFSLSVPVIGNGQCETVKDHIIDSKGGYIYTNYSSFVDILNEISSPTYDKTKKGIKGFKYIDSQYQWDHVYQKFSQAINTIYDEQRASITQERKD